MVVFTCGHCGESVQKPKVEKHYLTKCRNRNPNLSCMDCFKDFLGNDYEAHTKCVTEEERYSGKGFVAKEKKGERKQNTWVEMLQSVLDEQKSAPGNVRRIIESISKHNNTPRKKPKFVNFVKNVCGHKTNPKDIDQAWDYISVKLADLSVATAQNRNQKNGPEPKVKGEETAIEEIENGQSEKQIDVLGMEDQEDNSEKMVNGDVENEDDGETEVVDDKKLSKKQRKEEKKRQKYEAQLKSAVELPSEDDVEVEVQAKKGKKKKNKSESHSEEVEESKEDKKLKKRKRQDTANSVPEIHDDPENVETAPVAKEKTQKKKLRVDEANESDCLHNQNVAKIEELSMKNEKFSFNWHAVIMSVLEKKGNEVQFKRLQKKVLSEYSEATGREVDDRIADMFIKKLRSAPNVRVDKNRVLLVQ